MRTKSLFLAAAALAAGVATSMAQNVYSVNIVGYVSVPLVGGANVLLSNPLDNGSNTISSLDNGALPNKSTASIWNGAGFTGSSKGGGTWSANLAIPPGTAFFVKPNSAATITFVGSAPVSNNYALAGGAQVMIGAVIPTAGALTDAGGNSLNLGPSIPNKSSMSVWNGSGYTGAAKSGGVWTPNLSIGVAQGFFVKPNVAATWTQFLQ